jgi:hypothetical protein
MEHITIEEAEAMPESELHTLVTKIVDRKLEMFKTDLNIELLPIKLGLESHERQMSELRSGNAAVVAGLSRLEGNNEATRTEQRRQHAENSVKLDTALSRLDSHLGEHSGVEKHQDATEKQLDRRGDKHRAWVKVGLGLVSGGGVIKWVVDHWHKLHLK